MKDGKVRRDCSGWRERGLDDSTRDPAVKYPHGKYRKERGTEYCVPVAGQKDTSE